MSIISKMTPNEACAGGFFLGLGLCIGSLVGASPLFGIMGIFVMIAFVIMRSYNDNYRNIT